MKPASIKKFDMFWLGSIVVGLVGTVLGWDTMMEQMDTELAAQGLDAGQAGEFATGGAIIGLVIGIGISLLLWALISVWRIEFVKWLLALLVAWSVISAIMGLVAGTNLLTIFAVISAAMSVAAVYFVFQPDATAWFEEKRS